MKHDGFEVVTAVGGDIPPSAGYIRVAAVQTDPHIEDPDFNFNRTGIAMQLASNQGARIVVFPECSLTGYCFDSPEEGRAGALAPDDSRFAQLALLAGKLDMHVVVGFLQRTENGFANVAAIIGGQGIVGQYHKTHLPHLGADKFAEAGPGPLRVFEVDGVRLGLLICFDASFPEATRLLSLAGADLVMLPTNWPEEASAKATWLPNTRAYENVIYFASVNRVGEERGYRFRGGSRICDPEGKTLAEGPRDDEAMLVVDVELARARNKRIERRPGYWLDRIAGRREDLYTLEPGRPEDRRDS